ncbi:hypothetical protein ABZ876_03865 [Streptomyces sp. NPDC046931]|uniref:hypothetical protein n=1 Tax=Streptomyces sp. NPDC046931 TaxID=3154806 RepID=UPI003407B802
MTIFTFGEPGSSSAALHSAGMCDLSDVTSKHRGRAERGRGHHEGVHEAFASVKARGVQQLGRGVCHRLVDRFYVEPGRQELEPLGGLSGSAYFQGRQGGQRHSSAALLSDLDARSHPFVAVDVQRESLGVGDERALALGLDLETFAYHSCSACRRASAQTGPNALRSAATRRS